MSKSENPQIQELKDSFYKLSELAEKLKGLFASFSDQINQTSNKFDTFIELIELDKSTHDDTDLDTSIAKLQERPNHKNLIAEINYSYIDSTIYKSWIENLNKYSKAMGESKKYKQINSFCHNGRLIIESAIEVLFEAEYENITEKDKSFLDAYHRVEKSYNSRKNKSWSLPKIDYTIKDFDIDSKDLKKIGQSFISEKELKNIRLNSLPASVNICCEIFSPDFYKKNSYPTKDNYHIILNMNKLRNINSHGSAKTVDIQLNELGFYAKNLYDSPNNYLKIQESIEWFLKEVYKRVERISDN